MGEPTAIFANPYEITYLKNIWLLFNYGSTRHGFKAVDYEKISELTTSFKNTYSYQEIGEEYLKKILRADTSISFYKRITLDSLCHAISLITSDPNHPKNWQDLVGLHSEISIYPSVESLGKKFNKKRSVKDINLTLSRNIESLAGDDAFLYHADIRSINLEPSHNISINSLSDLATPVRIANENDVNDIYRFAYENQSYGNCPINGPNVKLPWWRKNPFIFYVIRDKKNRVCANLNLLPLKEECYLSLRSGQIEEQDIDPNDIYSVQEKDSVQFVYIEGINCPNTAYLKELITFSDKWLRNIVDLKRQDITLGAMGGTPKGIKLMEDLGFRAISADENKRGYKFYEVNFWLAVNLFLHNQNPV